MIEDVYEPFLMQKRILDRTPRGRVATVRVFHQRGALRLPALKGAQRHLWDPNGPVSSWL